MIDKTCFIPSKNWAHANFISTIGNLTPEAITGSDYTSELESIGIAVASASARMGELRPVSNLQRLYDAKGVILRYLKFYAYDVTLLTSVTQDADTNQAMVDSLSTDADAYMMSRFLNAVVGGWQPNWFRPEILVDGANILGAINTPHFGANAGDQSVGLPLPWCEEVNIDLGSFKSLRVKAPAFQKVDLMLQPYAIQCVMDLILY